MTMKVKFERNEAFLEETNDSTQITVLDTNTAIAMLH